MRFFTAFSLLFCSAMFAQEPPVAKEPSSKDKEVLKALISELDSEEINVKLKVVLTLVVVPYLVGSQIQS